MEIYDVEEDSDSDRPIPNPINPKNTDSPFGAVFQDGASAPADPDAPDGVSAPYAHYGVSAHYAPDDPDDPDAPTPGTPSVMLDTALHMHDDSEDDAIHAPQRHPSSRPVWINALDEQSSAIHAPQRQVFHPYGLDPGDSVVDAKRYAQVNRMGTVKISKLLAEFAIPSIVAMTVNGLYNIIDSIFMGHGVGEVGLATATVSAPLMVLAMALAMLIGIGGNALVALRLGEGKKQDAERILGLSLSLVIIVGLLSTGVILVFMDPVLRLSGATPDIWDSCHAFLRIIAVGMVFQFLSMGFNNFIRTAGNPARALYTMLAGVIVATFLNWLFVLQMGLGVEGSALATIIGQFISAAMVMYYFIFSKKAPFHLKLKNLPVNLRLTARILALGSASFVLQIAMAATNVILNHLLTQYGAGSPIGADGALAAIGVVSRVAMLTFFPIMGIATAVQPLIGFNFGALNYERVKKAFWAALIWILSFGTAFWIVVRIFPAQIAMLFGVSGDLLAFTAGAIQVQLFMIPVMGLQALAVNFFQSTAQPVKSLVLSLTRQIIFMIPLLFILPIVLPMISPHFISLDGLYWAYPICDITSAVTASLMMRREFKHINKRITQQRQEDAAAEAALPTPTPAPASASASASA